MCGIAGIIDYNSNEDHIPVLRRMLGIIRHRGPDSFGIYNDRGTYLASTRLSIIDLNTGDQPIHNEDKTVWVVLNGEIFNYPELRNELQDKGHKFYTTTDTEVLVHLYEEYGCDFLNMLNGQYAFAIWDHKKEQLLLGRDRVGIHPLFYNCTNQRIVFGSEIKAIFMDNRINRSLNTQTLSDIFTCWTPVSPDTVFKDVYQLPPAHYAVFSRHGIDIKRYWDFSFDEEFTSDKTLDESVEELNVLLKDAIRIRLRADVPVGAYLSGGLDSTFITSLVKKHFNNQLKTFSVSFSDNRFDEAQYQETAVQALETDHKIVKCFENDIGEIYPDIIWHTEVPLLRTGPAPLFQLSKLVRGNNFKVVLTGEGADEFFAGYNIFKEDRIRRFWAKEPESEIRPLLLKKLYPYIFTNDGKADAFHRAFFKKYLTDTDSLAYSHLLRWNNTSSVKNFFSDDIRNQTENLENFVNRYTMTLPPDYKSWAPLSRAQYIEASLFLSNYLLSSQGDRMAMGNSVEGRFPFLDHRVIEFASGIPPRFRLNGLTEKYILKRAANNVIPKELVERPKQPYRAPIVTCFMGQDSPDYVKELLSEKMVIEKGYFDPKRVSVLLSKCEREQGKILSERENMALVGILSTQLLDHLFLQDFPFRQIIVPDNIRIYKQEDN
ncbi:MAG: asparagine synthase (glutamine-hydrolyzing) [Desulfobacteraceae bacterium]|jgi:asparagine synthase (glutamine-hydrolysing)